MIRLHKIIIVLLLLAVPASAYSSWWNVPGFSVWGNGINLSGFPIWNGSVNGTNFEVCDTATNASSWNGSNLICVSKGGVETDSLAFANISANQAAWNNTENSSYVLNTTYANHSHVTEYYYPINITMNKGASITGNHTNLQYHNDIGVKIMETTGTSASTVTLNWTSPDTFETLYIYGKYDGGSTHYINVEIYNNNESLWHNIGSIPASVSNYSYSFNIPDPEHHVNGNTTVRLTHVGSGNINHYLWLDYVALAHGGSGGNPNTGLITAHIANTSNPHNVTWSQTGAQENISTGTSNQFWNGLKQWITLTAANITGFNASVNATVDRNLANYTNTFGWINNSTMSSDMMKANKSGDNFSGSIKIYNPSDVGYSSLSTCGGGVGINCPEFGVESYNYDESYMNFFTIRAISGDGPSSKYPYLFFSKIQANYSNGVLSNMTYIPDLTTIGLLSFQGSLNESKTLSGTKARIQVLSDGVWTASYWGTQMRLWTSSGKGITINQSGSIQLNAIEYSGSGNALTTVDSTGKLGRVTATSDPDSNNANNQYLCYDGSTDSYFRRATACT